MLGSVTSDTDLARMERDLAVERMNLRTAYGMIAFSAAALGFGLLLASKFVLGLVLVPLSAASVVMSVGWAIRHGRRSARLRREVRVRTQLPAARVVDR